MRGALMHDGDPIVAVVLEWLYDLSCGKQESAKCQNKQCARRPNVW